MTVRPFRASPAASIMQSVRTRRQRSRKRIRRTITKPKLCLSFAKEPMRRTVPVIRKKETLSVNFRMRKTLRRKIGIHQKISAVTENMQTVILTVESLSPKRADAVVASLLKDISRAAAIRLIESGNITVNGKRIKKSDKVAKGDVLTVVLPDPEPERALPEDIPLDIVYEDDDLLVVNKPKGMVVHPAAGNKEHTLVNALLFHCKDSLSGIGGVKRPGIVHRIDKDTSGLLIVAKNDFAHVGLASQIKDHSFTREYKAVVIGRIKNSEGIVDAPIGRHPVKRKCMAVTDKNSKNAVTHYFVERYFPGYTFVRDVYKSEVRSNRYD